MRRWNNRNGGVNCTDHAGPADMHLNETGRVNNSDICRGNDYVTSTHKTRYMPRSHPVCRVSTGMQPADHAHRHRSVGLMYAQNTRASRDLDTGPTGRVHHADNVTRPRPTFHRHYALSGEYSG